MSGKGFGLQIVAVPHSSTNVIVSSQSHNADLQVYCMWGGTFSAALLTLLMRNMPSGHSQGKHDEDASESLLNAPKPFSQPYSVVSSKKMYG